MVRIIFVVLLSLLASSCFTNSGAPPEDVDKAALQFFSRIKDADYNSVYDDAASGFKKDKTRDELVGNLTDLRSGGRVVGFSRLGTYFNNEGGKQVGVTTYLTQFERSKGEVKLFFIDESGEWKFSGFEFKPRN